MPVPGLHCFLRVQLPNPGSRHLPQDPAAIPWGHFMLWDCRLPLSQASYPWSSLSLRGTASCNLLPPTSTGCRSLPLGTAACPWGLISSTGTKVSLWALHQLQTHCVPLETLAHSWTLLSTVRHCCPLQPPLPTPEHVSGHCWHLEDLLFPASLLCSLEANASLLLSQAVSSHQDGDT